MVSSRVPRSSEHTCTPGLSFVSMETMCHCCPPQPGRYIIKEIQTRARRLALAFWITSKSHTLTGGACMVLWLVSVLSQSWEHRMENSAPSQTAASFFQKHTEIRSFPFPLPASLPEGAVDLRATKCTHTYTHSHTHTQSVKA